MEQRTHVVITFYQTSIRAVILHVMVMDGALRKVVVTLLVLDAREHFEEHH